MTWPAVAITLLALAILGGWAAIWAAVELHERELKRWRDRAERTHAYYAAMRKAWGREHTN